MSTFHELVLNQECTTSCCASEDEFTESGNQGLSYVGVRGFNLTHWNSKISQRYVYKPWISSIICHIEPPDFVFHFCPNLFLLFQSITQHSSWRDIDVYWTVEISFFWFLIENFQESDYPNQVSIGMIKLIWPHKL